MQDIIFHDTWRWPIANSPDLLTLKEITLSIPPPNTSLSDTVIWRNSNEHTYSTKNAWNQIREVKSKVDWCTLVWFNGCLPKAAFFLWLAVKKKLGTQDSIRNIQSTALCLFCGREIETHSHLFFQCSFSMQVWRCVLQKGSFSAPSLPWDDLITWIVNNWNGQSLTIKAKKLCLATTVYTLWRDKNDRYHNNSVSRAEHIASSIIGQVRLKLSTYTRIVDNTPNRLCQAVWSLPISIFGV